MGLEWARGTEPTPRGPITVDLHRAGSGLTMQLTLPLGVDAEVSMPALSRAEAVQVNGQPVAGLPAENGTRLVIELNKPGAYKLEAK